PRYSQREVDALLEQARRQPVAADKSVPREVGTGALPLIVTGIRQLTPRTRAYELRHADGEPLPDYRAGAHIRVPIELPDGGVTSRTYSLTDAPGDPDCYRIAVLRVDSGAGGSRALHAGWQLGTRLNVDAPDNFFPLHDDDRPALLIAGGIGITPIKAMAEALAARGTDFQLHYTGRTPQEMAFIDDLRRHLADRCRFYFSRIENPTRPDMAALLAAATADSVIYVCGPIALLDGVRQSARRLGIDEQRLQFESFI
ncbi:MAG: ferredoxin reductase, partial [Gammaproteobacteria bacterium]